MKELLEFAGKLLSSILKCDEEKAVLLADADKTSAEAEMIRVDTRIKAARAEAELRAHEHLREDVSTRHCQRLAQSKSGLGPQYVKLEQSAYKVSRKD